jgi:YhcG PDDEXK nuclease domain
MVEFLDLQGGHSEADLHRGLLGQLRHFLIELGRDFCFVGSEFPLQVGGRDFALDRDVKKPHENPAIGVLLCASKDDEVVEYALSRSLSPALIAEYQTQLPDKRLLQQKLHEFYQLNLS